MRPVCVWAVTLSSREPTSLRSCLARREGDGSRAAPPSALFYIRAGSGVVRRWSPRGGVARASIMISRADNSSATFSTGPIGPIVSMMARAPWRVSRWLPDIPMVMSRGASRVPAWAARADAGFAAFEVRACVARGVPGGCADDGSAS